jgi:hypothetical protein
LSKCIFSIIRFDLNDVNTEDLPKLAFNYRLTRVISLKNFSIFYTLIISFQNENSAHISGSLGLCTPTAASIGYDVKYVAKFKKIFSDYDRPCGVYYNIKLHLLRDRSSRKQSKEQIIRNERIAEHFGGGLDVTTNPITALRCIKYVFRITNLV